jgi:hypothetical protein
MPIYTGRAKLRTGMSRNQRGLKMSGSSSRVGRPLSNKRVISKRVRSNLKPCGGFLKNGYNTGVFIRTKNCVNRKNDPCSKINKNTFETLTNHFNTGDKNWCLVGVSETLKTDLGNDLSKRVVAADGKIIHYDTNSDNFNGLPLKVQDAVKTLNELKIDGYINKKLGYVRHIIATVTDEDIIYLKNAGFGELLNLCGSWCAAFAQTGSFFSNPECYHHSMNTMCGGVHLSNVLGLGTWGSYLVAPFAHAAPHIPKALWDSSVADAAGDFI